MNSLSLRLYVASVAITCLGAAGSLPTDGLQDAVMQVACLAALAAVVGSRSADPNWVSQGRE